MKSESNLLNIFHGLAENALSTTLKVLGALALIIIGILISKWVAKIIKRFLQRTRIDRLTQRLNDVDFIAKSNMDIKLSDILSKVFYYIFVLITLVAASDILDMPAISNFISDVINFIPNLIVAGLILIIGIIASDAVRNIVLTTCKSLGIPSGKLISSFVFYFLLINVAITALKQSGIEMDSLSQNIQILLGGIVLAFAIGYGLASRSVFSNILTSYYHKDVLKIGDHIEMGKYKGKVISVDKNSVHLENESGKIILPLSRIATEEIIIHNS